LRTAVRAGAEAADVASGLALVGLADPVARDVAAVATKAKGAALAGAYAAAAPQHARVQHVRWRVDVVISSSSVSRVMRPSLLMELTLSDGRIEVMEVPVEEFHTLRYTAAKLLAEMGSVEGHPVLRIQ
jgi:hypothetical protein